MKIVIVEKGAGPTAFASEKEAVAFLELPDVAEGTYEAFDQHGHPLMISIDGDRIALEERSDDDSNCTVLRSILLDSVKQIRHPNVLKIAESAGFDFSRADSYSTEQLVDALVLLNQRLNENPLQRIKRVFSRTKAKGDRQETQLE